MMNQQTVPATTARIHLYRTIAEPLTYNIIILYVHLIHDLLFLPISTIESIVS